MCTEYAWAFVWAVPCAVLLSAVCQAEDLKGMTSAGLCVHRAAWFHVRQSAAASCRWVRSAAGQGMREVERTAGAANQPRGGLDQHVACVCMALYFVHPVLWSIYSVWGCCADY